MIRNSNFHLFVISYIVPTQYIYAYDQSSRPEYTVDDHNFLESYKLEIHSI